MLRKGLTAVSLPAVCLVAVFLPGRETAVSTHTAEKPNIVFILADDMRKDDLKYMPKTRSPCRRRA